MVAFDEFMLGNISLELMVDNTLENFLNSVLTNFEEAYVSDILHQGASKIFKTYYRGAYLMIK